MRSILSGVDLHICGAMLSDPGTARAVNEDFAAYVLPKAEDPRSRRGALALVADGMGGHAAGEVASALAADVILKTFYDGKGAPYEALEAAFYLANDAIYREAQDRAECQGMGTTCTTVAICDGQAYLAHVGDSRLYLLRDTHFTQLSEDHSLVMDLVRSGVITVEEARDYPDRNVILRALGTRPQVEISVWREGLPLKPGDILLLCSDGLTDCVEDLTIKGILWERAPFEACRMLIAAALDAGGDDNITVGVFGAYNELPSSSRVVGVTRSSRVRTS